MQYDLAETAWIVTETPTVNDHNAMIIVGLEAVEMTMQKH